MSKVYIYGLVDPRTNQVRYIGKTTNLRMRLEGHIKNRKSNKEKCDWIDLLLEFGLKPKIKTLEVCSNDNWAEREIWWIAHGYEIGWDLLNKTEGGEPGWTGCSKFFDFMQKHLGKVSWEIFNNLNYDQKADIVCRGAQASIEGKSSHALMDRLCREYCQ